MHFLVQGVNRGRVPGLLHIWQLHLVLLRLHVSRAQWRWLGIGLQMRGRSRRGSRARSPNTTLRQQQRNNQSPGRDEYCIISCSCSNVDDVDVGIRGILVCESEGYQGHGISGSANQGGFGGIRIIKSQRPRRRRRSLNNTGRLWSPKPGASLMVGKWRPRWNVGTRGIWVCESGGEHFWRSKMRKSCECFADRSP